MWWYVGYKRCASLDQKLCNPRENDTKCRVTETGTKYTFIKIEYIYIEIYFLGSLIYFFYLCLFVSEFDRVLCKLSASSTAFTQSHNDHLSSSFLILQFYTSHTCSVAIGWNSIFFLYSIQIHGILCKSFQKYSSIDASMHLSLVHCFNFLPSSGVLLRLDIF